VARLILDPELTSRRKGLNGCPGTKIVIIIDASRSAVPMVARTKRLNVFLEPNPIRKRDLQERLTATLPGWFGKADSNAKYACRQKS